MKAKVHSAKVIHWRFYFILLALLGLLIALIFHLASLQVLPNESRGYEFLQNQGLERTLRSEPIPAMRGLITDRQGKPLAVSTPVISIWAHPKQLAAAKEHWGDLSKQLGITRKALQEKIDLYRNKEFMYLRRHMTPNDAGKILALDIPGVYKQQEYRRFYPAGEVAAHLVGFSNIDNHGQEGVELAYDQWLSGATGEKQVLKDLRGRAIKDVNLVRAAKPGKDIALSIDLRLQYLAYRELKATVQAHKAKSGSVVLLDAKTGEILAMANQPSYNPNDRRRLPPGVTRNRAMTDQFEPGSTMKPITVMAALETGRYSPATQIDTHPGYMRVGKKTLLDPVNYGVMNVEKIIQKSSQVGLTKISLDLEGNDIRDMYFRLGLGQDTGTGFPGESIGLLPSYTKWQPIVQANFSFGYGLSLTALQLAQAYSVIANAGVKKPVSLLKISDEPKSSTVVEYATAKQVATMLKKVVQVGGTAARAQVKSYSTAGKTGTIHKASKGGYADDRYLSLFAGFAPADDPKIVVIVAVNEPSRGKYFGGEVAAPVFSKVVEQTLHLLRVPPEQNEISDSSKQVAKQKIELNNVKTLEPLT